MNSAVLAPKALGNMFIKEKEYTPSELGTPTGQNGPPEQEMLIMPPTIMRQHTQDGIQIMKINSVNNNEQTSSSLGKRNYNEFSKGHLKNGPEDDAESI